MVNILWYVKFNGNWCWTSPTWSQVQFWLSWSRVELQLDQNWTWVELHEVIHHRLQSSPSRPSWSPTRQRRVGLQLGRDGLDWSCTRWTSVDSTQGHRVQVQVQRGAAELNLDFVALSWSWTRRRTSTSTWPRCTCPSFESNLQQVGEVQHKLQLNLMLVHFRPHLCSGYTDQYHSCKRSRVQWSLKVNRMEFWHLRLTLVQQCWFHQLPEWCLSHLNSCLSPHFFH